MRVLHAEKRMGESDETKPDAREMSMPSERAGSGGDPHLDP